MLAPYNEPSPNIQIANIKYNEKDEAYPIITFAEDQGWY